MSGFKDHFSDRAGAYAAFRPRYPDELFDWLAGMAPGRGLAWDAATGNGQAAVALAARFERVIATDASAEQLAHAEANPRVEYRVERAERSGLPNGSCHLVTAAQALHWLSPAEFFAEARRVLVPRGMVAVWAYREPRLEDPADRVLQAFARLVEPCWPPERSIVETGYREVTFPFEEIAAPRFPMHMVVTPATLVGYLRTWSATRRFIQREGNDPVNGVERELAGSWPADATRTLRWELELRAGRVPG